MNRHIVKVRRGIVSKGRRHERTFRTDTFETVERYECKTQTFPRLDIVVHEVNSDARARAVSAFLPPGLRDRVELAGPSRHLN